MFVRAQWRDGRLEATKRNLREIYIRSPRDVNILCLNGRDFSKMTRGLFDR